MRGRRHKLQVSTFPFLAVLLCAMGSLILVLLVMDRKAHQAAQNRARREAARLSEQCAQTEAARLVELEEKQRQARAAWEQKRDALHARLTKEQIALELQMRKVRDQLSQIAARLRYEQDTSTELRRKVEDVRGKNQAGQQLLGSLHGSAKQTEARAGESNKTLQRMTADLLQMEQTLKDLKAAKEREQHTFSVVPYHGRRGESRRPIYVECTADGVIFHPERRAMAVTSREFIVGREQSENAPADVRSEVERRIARQSAQLAGKTPYLLLLVRPDGIATYCLFQAVLKDLTLDFGYEFIDADWVLDFPADDEQPSAQPWMAASKTSIPAAAPSSDGRSNRPVALAPRPEPLAVSGGEPPRGRMRQSEGASRWSQGIALNQPGASGGTRSGAAGAGVSASDGAGAASPSGMRFVPPIAPFVVGGGNTTGGTPQLAQGANPNTVGLSSGQSSGMGGQRSGGGSSAAPGGGSAYGQTGGGNSPTAGTAAGSGGGRGPSRSDSTFVRGSGRGHPAAMAPALQENDSGASGTASGSDGYVLRGSGNSYFPGSAPPGSPSGSGVAAPGLGAPRALTSGPIREGIAGGGGTGSPGVGSSGTGVPGPADAGPPGRNITGSTGSGSPGDGMQRGGMAGGTTGGRTATGNGTYPPYLSGSPNAAGSPSGGPYPIARSDGATGSMPPSRAGGASGGTASGTGAMSAAGMTGGNAGPASAGNTGQASPGPAGTMGQGGSGTPSAGQSQPGASGDAPGDGGVPAPRGQESSVYASVDPLAPRRPRGLPPRNAEDVPPPEPSPDEANLPHAPRKKRLLPAGGGDGEGGSGDPASAAMGRAGLAPPSAGERPARRPTALRPAWVHGGRDWTLYVECLPNAVKLYPSERTFPLAQVAVEGPNNPLVAALRQAIDRRQASRRPGEPPYHPQVCLLVRAEHVRTFLAVYPVLEALPVPKTRRNLDVDDDVAAIVTGASP